MPPQNSPTRAVDSFRKWSPRLHNIFTVLERVGNQPRHQYGQVARAIYQQRVPAYSQMTFLPLAVRAQLTDELGPRVSSLSPRRTSPSDQCVKTLYSLADTSSIETVWMRFRDSQHASLCISSQVGCALRCNFCATGAVGLKRQLTADEIVDQVLGAPTTPPLDTVSFMGMGEALQNPRVFDALHLLTHPQAVAMSPRRISVSTVGVVPGIRRMTRDFPHVNLAFSLHSPFMEQRDVLVPNNRTHPLPDVLDALRDHAVATRRKIFIAYLVLPGFNDSADHGKAMVQLIKDTMPASVRHLFHINLLRYNPAEGITEQYGKTTTADLERFGTYIKQGGLPFTIRQSFGVDIDAACGQLYQIARREDAEAAAVSKQLVSLQT